MLAHSPSHTGEFFISDNENKDVTICDSSNLNGSDASCFAFIK